MQSPVSPSRAPSTPHIALDAAATPFTSFPQRWSTAALLGILALAALLRFVRLDQQGYGNLFYAVGVHSMLQSWHNFFFVAFDPQGFLAIDKPPLGLWIQALSVLIFGWNGWSLLLPQALAGTVSVGVLFVLVRRGFGIEAGLLAALVFALTPIAVATDRNNTMDSLLVLVLLLAALCVGAAAESGRLPLLLLGAVWLGIGFNIKMLQAFLPLPAFCLWYLAAGLHEWPRRLKQLALAGVVVALVSLPWVVAVDLTPANLRPFIASSSNSELDLIIGHNGAARLMQNPLREPTPLTRYVADEIGVPGPLRLWQPQLGGQVSWLLPLAVIGLGLAFWKPLRGANPVRARSTLLMWGLWLGVELLFFSVGRKFHRYYLVMLGPPIAALVGIGLVALWQQYHARTWHGWLLPAALLGATAGQVAILLRFPAWGRLLAPMVGGVGVSAALALLELRRRQVWRGAGGACVVGVLALLLAPTAWAITPLWGAHPSQPYAGPDLWDAPMNRAALHPDSLVTYLQSQQEHTRFLAATIEAATAAPMMLESGAAVMTLGGYSGGDAIVTPEQFAARVAANEVHFVLLPTTTEQQPALVGWVYAHCGIVSPSVWSAPSTHADAPSAASVAQGQTLFNCT